MRVTVIDRIGGHPLVLEASQVVICNDENTPLAAASEYGPTGCHRVESCADPARLNEFLRYLGYGRYQVEVRKLPV